MISRIVSTVVLVLLSAGAFLSQATFAEQSDSTVFLFFGVAALFLAILNWFAWPTIRAGWEAGHPPDFRPTGLPPGFSTRQAIASVSRGPWAGTAGPDLPVSAAFWPVYVGGLLNALSVAGLHRPKPRAPTDHGDWRS